MAFCALIAHYRPDLINMSSLNPSNALENLQLGLSTAERIGIGRRDLVMQPMRTSLARFLFFCYFLIRGTILVTSPSIRVCLQTTLWTRKMW